MNKFLDKQISLETYKNLVEIGSDIPIKVREDLIKDVEIGQIRELNVFPVERFVVLDIIKKNNESDDIVIIASLTPLIELLPKNSLLYRLKNRNLNLGIIPVKSDMIYKRFIENYSITIAKVPKNEIRNIKVYIDYFTTFNKTINYFTKELIKLNSKRWSRWIINSYFTKDMNEEEVERFFINEMELDKIEKSNMKKKNK